MIIPSLPSIPTPAFNLSTRAFTDTQDVGDVLVTLLARDGPECTDIFRCRTTSSIVYSCLSTIFACTWAALHHDVSIVPGLEKVLDITMALLTPELIVAMALIQRLKASMHVDNWNTNFVPLCSPELLEVPGMTRKQYESKLRDTGEDGRWNGKHGFLTGMGGIVIFKESGEELKDFEPTKEFFEDPRMRSIIQQIALISSKDIKDKSKSDWIAKGYVIIQTIWFIVQCIARQITHLPLTELEVVTLAYAVQNILIYAFWGNKPQGLSVPYRFYLVDEPVSEQLGTKGEGKEANSLSTPEHPDGVLSPNSIIDSATVRVSDSSQKGCMPTKEWIPSTPSPVQGFLLSLYERYDDGPFFGLAGAVFGAIHLIPVWFSAFPSTTEKVLWRASAIGITALPLMLVLTSLIEPHLSGRISKRAHTITDYLLLGAYIIGRVILIVLTFKALRSLPADALRSFEWTRFIPHF